MAVESLGKCLRALQVAFSDYSGYLCRLISRLVIKKPTHYMQVCEAQTVTL